MELKSYGYTLRLNGTGRSIGFTDKPKSESREDLLEWAKTLAAVDYFDDWKTATIERAAFGYKRRNSRNSQWLYDDDLFTFTRSEIVEAHK